MQVFDIKNKKQLLITFLCLLICLCSLLPHLLTSETKSTPYPLEMHPAYYNAYVEQFDAFMKGQLNIDYEPSEKLLNLDNPYDWQQRKAGNIGHYLWDRALYDGKYYSYFGIAPIITVYAPSYLLTGTIPSDTVTCTVLAVVGMVSICFALINLIRYFKIKIPFYLFILGLFSIEMGSLLPMLMSSADMYYIASTSAVAYFSLFLALFFGAMNVEKRALKNVLFALCSIAFVLVIMSRPNVALLGILICPVLFKYFFKSGLKLKEKIASFICFATPLLIGAIVVCTYNYLRFDSIFEFGATYQLTVYDVSKYSISFALLFPCVFHYFLQMPIIKSAFPFIDLLYAKFVNLPVPYLYTTSTIGALAFLSNWGVAGYGYILTKSKEHREQKFTYLFAFLSVFALAFLNTCMGGINLRYFADFNFVLILFNTIILFEIAVHNFKKKKLRIIAHIAVSFMLIMSALLGFLLIFENERCYILKSLSMI